MKSKVTNLIKAVVFSVMGVIMFIALQNFFIPDSSIKQGGANKTILGFREIEKNTVDVIFLGTSTMKQGILPMELYEDAGIISYNLGTDAQPFEGSYYLLKDAFTKQKPSVVVLEIAQLFQKDTADNALRWRHILDNYPMCSLKIEMAKSYAELKAGDGFMSVVFPITKYHTRWSSLTQSDFIPNEKRMEYYTGGAYIMTLVSGDTYSTQEEIDYLANRQQEPETLTQYEDGVWSSEIVDEPLYVPSISDRNISYLLKLKELCEENGAQLVLTKMPTLRYTQQSSGAWTHTKSEMTRNVANKYGLRFFDLIYDADCGINWETETIDSGVHINIRGEKKATAVMEQYLLQHFSFPQTSSVQYDEYLALYHKVNDVAMLQSETDFHAYLQRLIDNKDKYLILISSDEDFMLAMDDFGYQLLEELGLQMTRDAAFRDAYLAILDQGRLRYEAVSGRRIDYTTTIDDVNISMSSAGWNVGAYCKLSVNGRDYARSVRGLNFVVYDPESKLVIDSVSFDTSLPTMKVTRNGATTESLLRAYEQKMCF